MQLNFSKLVCKNLILSYRIVFCLFLNEKLKDKRTTFGIDLISTTN